MFEKTNEQSSCLTMAHYEDSLSCILNQARCTEVISSSILEAIGCVLAEDLIAPISVPSFDNSAMDGFAFSSRSTDGASSTRPVSMPIVGACIAGDTAGQAHLQPGFAAKIMTGAPMPEGADTILPVEYASWQHDKLSFYEPYPSGKHVRYVGEDVTSGTVVLNKGTRISGQHVPLLCALGLSQIKIQQAPRVSWITTGQEISDKFDEPLVPGHIYNATGLYGTVAATDMGFDLEEKITVRDTPQDFAAALDTALDKKVDIIISTGGVSAGEYDFVRPVLEDAGGRILLHKARIKPGKPVLFAVLPNGTYFFGLPGNPISTAIALRVFVYPFVRKILGQGAEPHRTAKLLNAQKSSGGRTVFLMGTLDISDKGELIAKPRPKQQSFQTSPFAKSSIWIVTPEGTETLEAGSTVQWLPIEISGL